MVSRLFSLQIAGANCSHPSPVAGKLIVRISSANAVTIVTCRGRKKGGTLGKNAAKVPITMSVSALPIVKTQFTTGKRTSGCPGPT